MRPRAKNQRRHHFETCMKPAQKRTVNAEFNGALVLDNDWPWCSCLASALWLPFREHIAVKLY
jgi:hypothetical protein